MCGRARIIVITDTVRRSASYLSILELCIRDTFSDCFEE